MTDIAFVEFSTHAVTIMRSESDIRCFKMSRGISPLQCEYKVFCGENATEDAIDYTARPFNTLVLM